jgi:hypothetical protein
MTPHTDYHTLASDWGEAVSELRRVAAQIQPDDWKLYDLVNQALRAAGRAEGYLDGLRQFSADPPDPAPDLPGSQSGAQTADDPRSCAGAVPPGWRVTIEFHPCGQIKPA